MGNRTEELTSQMESAVFPSVEALANHLGISRQSAYVAMRAGAIPHIKIGKRFVIPKAAIARWLESAGSDPDLVHPSTIKKGAER